MVVHQIRSVRAAFRSRLSQVEATETGSSTIQAILLVFAVVVLGS